ATPRSKSRVHAAATSTTRRAGNTSTSSWDGAWATSGGRGPRYAAASTRSPQGLTRCCRATGGSEAVELALQAAMLHTGRKKFVALDDAYHGNTLGALSVGDGDDAVHVLSVARLKPPLDADALDRLETRLKHRDVAAVIMEPIAMNLGVLIPETEDRK